MWNPDKFEPQFKKLRGTVLERAEDKINTLQIIKNFQEENRSKLNDLEQRIDDLKRLQETKKLEQKVKEESLESLKLELEGEKIYSNEFVERLDEILLHEFRADDEKFVLKDVVDGYLEKFSKSNALNKEERVELQKQFVKDLINWISKTPHNIPWSFNFERAVKTDSLDCATCTSLTGLILESTKGITNIQNIEYGHPYGHAVNIVTFDDGHFYYVDSRNNIFEDLTNNVEIEEKNGLRIYKVKQLKGQLKKKRGYKIIPAVSLKEGILNSYLDNLTSAYLAAKGEFEPYFKKTKTPEQLEKIQAEAKIVCREEGLSEEKYHLLKKIRKVFGENLIQYEKSQEFQNEVKRWEEAFEFEKSFKTKLLEPLRELIKRNEKVRQEIVLKKDEIISFLLFKTNELPLNNKEAKQLIESFRESKKKLRSEHPSWYEEDIHNLIDLHE